MQEINLNPNNFYLNNKINTSEILDNCINETNNKLFILILTIFILTLFEYLFLYHKFNNKISYETRLIIYDYIKLIKNVLIINLFLFELFFYILY